MQECSDLLTYQSGQIQHILIVHGQNMELAGICRARHNALVKYLQSFPDENGQ